MTKGFFQSKTIILALVGLGLAIVGFFTKKNFPPELAEQITALDWANTGNAIVTTLIIIVRVLFPSGAKITGLWNRILGRN